MLPVYIEVLQELAKRGAEWVQLDEPCLVLDLNDTARQALQRAYAAIAKAVPSLKIMLTTYFGEIGDNLETALALPVAGLHVDLVRAPDQLEGHRHPAHGRIWSSRSVSSTGATSGEPNLAASLERLEPAIADLGSDRVQIAPSCSLLHVPIDLELETGLDPDVKSWLAFSVQKIRELAVLGQALAGSGDTGR